MTAPSIADQLAMPARRRAEAFLPSTFLLSLSKCPRMAVVMAFRVAADWVRVAAASAAVGHPLAALSR